MDKGKGQCRDSPTIVSIQVHVRLYRLTCPLAPHPMLTLLHYFSQSMVIGYLFIRVCLPVCVFCPGFSGYALA